MAVSEYAELDGVTVGTTELSILSGTTTLQSRTDQGVYSLWLDASAMAKGDEYFWTVKEKCESTGGSTRVVFQGVLADAQVEPLITPPLMLKNGWDMTLRKSAGTDRAWDASVRGVSGTIVEPFELDGVTVGTTELSIVSGTTALQTNTDDGVYQLYVDPSVMTKGDQFAVRIYEKVEATGGTKRQVYEAILGDQNLENLVTPMLTLMHGWDMTIQKIAGTDRAFDASIRKVA